MADGGTEAQRQQFNRPCGQLDQYAAADGARGIKRVGEQMNSIHHFPIIDRASWWHD